MRDEAVAGAEQDRGQGDDGLDVLITSIDLEALAGANLYVRDVALGLRSAGHRPTVYSPRLGSLADELEAGGIRVLHDLGRLEAPPDVALVNQTVQAYEVALRFPPAPIVFVSHGPLAWMAEPPRLDAVQIFVAVGSATEERLRDAGIPEDVLRLVPNGVDTARFRSSGRALPARPRRALVFSNNAAEVGWASLVRTACEQRGIDLDVRGRGVGEPLRRPEDVLPSYDLVFARGRCAREALACGCGVVLMDVEGMATLVGPEDVVRYNGGAFGSASFTRAHDVDAIGAEIDRFEPELVRGASDLLRQIGSLETMVSRLIECLREATSGNSDRSPDPTADLSALLGYLPTLSTLGLERDEVLLARHLLHEHAVHLEQRVNVAEPALVEARAELAAAREQLVAAGDELEALQGTRVVRARDTALGAGRVGTALRSLYRPFRR